MKPILLALLFATGSFFGGCSVHGLEGDGNITSENRALSEVTSVVAAGAFDIQWAGGSPALTITADQNLLPHIRTEVAGKTLRISSDTSIAPTKGIKITIASGALEHVELSGANHFTGRKVSGNALSITASGATTVDVDGSVSDLSADLTGASRLNAPALNTKSAKVTITGACSGEVAVAESLRATITGAGSLTYSGQPATVEKNVTGAGTIRRRP